MLQIASVLFGLMTMILPFITPDPSPVPLEGKKVVVGKEGVTLYPRFNKSLKPLSEREEGRILIVLREFKAWMQVEVEGSDLKGWITVEVQRTGGGFQKKYDTVAAPSVAGLVARGWAERYARRSGADFSKVKALKQRLLDADKYEKFLDEGGE